MRLKKKEKEKTQTNCTFYFFFLRYIQKGLFFKKININIMTKKKNFSSIKKNNNKIKSFYF